MKYSYSERALGLALTLTEYLLLLGLIHIEYKFFSKSVAASQGVSAVFIIVGLVLVIRGCFALTRTPKEASFMGSFNGSTTPRKNGALVTEEAFSMFRHPIYVGLLIAGIGTMVIDTGWTSRYCWAILALILYWKSTVEESLLSARFPDYASYRQRVHLLPLKFKNPR